MSDDLVKRLRYGIVEHRKRWSGDTHADLGGSVDYDATTDMLNAAADRIEELEAKLVKAVEALERIEDASRYFGNNPEASETTVRYAHETTRRLCSTTLAELKGEKDE
jgi:hypothetical protein